MSPDLTRSPPTVFPGLVPSVCMAATFQGDKPCVLPHSLHGPGGNLAQSLLKLMSIELVMPSNHLILCHPLLLLPSIFLIPERLRFHFSLSCIGGGDGNPLQCSCLENPRDGGAWWLPSMGLHRVGHTPVVLAGKSHGQRSLAGYSPWDCKSPSNQ